MVDSKGVLSSDKHTYSKSANFEVAYLKERLMYAEGKHTSLQPYLNITVVRQLLSVISKRTLNRRYVKHGPSVSQGNS